MEPELRRVRSRRNKVGATKCRKEVIQRGFIRDVDGVQLQAPFVAIAMKEIIVSHRYIKQVARIESRWPQDLLHGSGSGQPLRWREGAGINCNQAPGRSSMREIALR